MGVSRIVGFLAVLWASLIAGAVNSASLLRDPDIERGLRELAAPILNAAGLSTGSVKILIVDDPSLNAFVIDQKHIFLHSGLILKLETAEQLQAVIAHEAAHIANGHISRRISNMGNANLATAFGVLVAIAAAAAGEGEAAAGVAAGTAGSARGVLLGHTRSEESSADQSALRYLTRAQSKPKAMAEVFELFRGQEALSVGRQDPYARSHPLTRDRIRAVQGYVAGAPSGIDQLDRAYWFARIQGKLSAFKRAPKWTLRRAKGSSDVDTMRRAVAFHRQSNKKEATSLIASLVAKRPKDPYFRELQGQILLESRDYAGAVRAYKRAVELSPNDALILGGYGRALLVQNTAASNKLALSVLRKANARDRRDARILRDLATAYAKAGDIGNAALATAERYALRGDMKNARIQAKRAAGALPRGSAGWQRAQDIIGRG